ncbi:hypothetical protein CABS01_05181 [Colletotrichum abscissum]|uniref:Uncharacterized protein n=1 Tax=Colletotrichum abscissum TaxID=1671311 RepID=A0A9P9XBS9_9PEZI|nr:uncharacterized protein CABS01_05181 [Colletotrichum abscissum]KAI3545982.1 hypothetical protein CABS02_09188 [Colletotrichum abscissum]KAK1523560.1 hypothetical protein CABS01_05181 [Colletotrichum abscissum]
MAGGARRRLGGGGGGGGGGGAKSECEQEFPLAHRKGTCAPSKKGGIPGICMYQARSASAVPSPLSPMVHHPDLELVSRVVDRLFPPREAGKKNGETGEDPESRPEESITVQGRDDVG